MKTALSISYINIALNVLLAAVKLTVGMLSGSSALISDGVHSVTDVFSSVVVLIGIALSARRSDRQHPYGHERMECVAAVLLAILVGFTGVGIGVSGIRSAFGAQEGAPPGGAALAVAVGSILIKEIMFRYTRHTALRVKSGALLADAWHFRTDALSSVGGFIGILGANLGMAVLDPLAGVVISLFIVKAAVEIFVDAMRKMTDRSCDEHLQNAIEACVKSHEQVKDICDLKTRLFGSRVYAEVTIAVDGTLSCREAFAVARRIEQTVCEEFEEVKDCSVHIYPQ